MQNRKLDDHETVKIIVSETLSALGFDMSQPHEIQQDIAWIRKMRQAGEGAWKIGITAFFGITVPAACYAMWEGIKHFVRVND